MTVLTGDNDPRVSIDEAASWEAHTTGPTELRVYPGGHFFLTDQSTDVIELLTERLVRQSVLTPGRPRVEVM